MTSKSNMNVTVVGAGIVGTTVARLLQQKHSNINITILADKFDGDTLSAVAGGFFRPGPSFKGPTPEITQKWVYDSWSYYQNIYQTSDAAKAGIMELSSYILSKDNPHVTRNHLLEGILPVYRAATAAELKAAGDGWKYGSYFTSLKIESSAHLPWANQQFCARGGKIIKQRVESLGSLKEYDLVFNCTGLGAKFLCNDHDLVPMRGQIIRVKAPWLTTAFYGDYDAYIFPGFNGIVTMGGTRQYDSYNTKVCPHDAAGIMERCFELVPSLKNAPVVGHYVGLRPHRSPVRVESELMGGVKVVHCYGHGGYGVTCAPGTAMHALQLGEELLKSNSRSKL